MHTFIGRLWTGSRADCWDLHTLAVSPDHQNCGYGRQLVAWGLEQAEREKVAASVLSADKKEAFYQRCGYGPVVGRATDGVGNRLKGRVMGGAIMFRDFQLRDSK
jgi:predicted N-acetyltransferase YhbS